MCYALEFAKLQDNGDRSDLTDLSQNCTAFLNGRVVRYFLAAVRGSFVDVCAGGSRQFADGQRLSLGHFEIGN